MLMEKFKKALLSVADDMSAIRLAVQRLFLIAALFIFCIQLLIKKSLLPIAIAFFALSVLYFLLIKGERKDKKILKVYHAALYGSSIYIASFISAFILNLPSSTLFCLMILMVCVVVAYTQFSEKGLKDDVTTRWEDIEAFIKAPLFCGKDGGIDPFATIVGEDTILKKPNVIPYKDRFLHFLVVGPTGSGKTSQSLIPMSFRDLENKDMGVVVLEPKGDFADQVYAYAKLRGRKNVVYFNPILDNCPYYNPLRGDLNDVIENITTAFGALDTDSKAYFQNMNRNLLVSGITVIKSVYGDNATLVQLNNLFTNYEQAKRMLDAYKNNRNIKTTAEIEHRNEIVNWFENDYMTGMAGGNKADKKTMPTKTFENSSGIRTQLTNLISNDYLRRVLNPPNTEELRPDEYIDFDRVLENGEVLCMCSAQGVLRDLGQTLGMFLIQSFEASVFKRPGNENTRKGCIFYVDEFQKYANKGYNDLLTQGRSYRVSSVLATQSLDGIAINSGSLGKVLKDVVATNCRNKIFYGDISVEDARYFSKLCGTKKVKKEKVTISRGRSIFSKYDIGDQRESYNSEEVDKPIFTESEILLQPFGHAICKCIVNNTVQEARAVTLHYVSADKYEAVNNYVAVNITPHMMNSPEYKERIAKEKSAYDPWGTAALNEEDGPEFDNCEHTKEINGNDYDASIPNLPSATTNMPQGYKMPDLSQVKPILELEDLPNDNDAIALPKAEPPVIDDDF